MKIQVIKKEIPEEISEQGGCSLQIVNKETVDLETTIDEAKDQLCVIGDKLLIKGEFVGMFKSMIAGIERDGNARTLGDFLTLYPVPTGEFDLDKGWDPAVNGVRIRARLLNEMDIDISKWEFEDVTPGRQAFTIESVQAGSVTGVIACDQAAWINGRNLPATADVRVDYAIPETGVANTFPANKVTSSATRLDIAADAIAALNVPANDGKKIELTVRGNCANAKISAVLKYVAPPTTITLLKQGGFDDNVVSLRDDVGAVSITGTMMKLATGDTAKLEADFDGTTDAIDITNQLATNTDTLLASSEDGIVNNSQHSDENWTGKAATLVLTKSGVRYTKAVTFYS